MRRTQSHLSHLRTQSSQDRLAQTPPQLLLRFRYPSLAQARESLLLHSPWLMPWLMIARSRLLRLCPTCLRPLFWRPSYDWSSFLGITLCVAGSRGPVGLSLTSDCRQEQTPAPLRKPQQNIESRRRFCRTLLRCGGIRSVCTKGFLHVGWSCVARTPSAGLRGAASEARRSSDLAATSAR